MASTVADSSASGSSAADLLATTAHTDATKTRLKSMTDGLEDFSNLLRTGNRQRREREDHRIAELKAEIATVERTITTEIDKRVEMAKALQSWAETQVIAIRNKLEALLSASKADTDKKVEELHVRIAQLESKFEEDRVTVMADVKKRNEDLVQSLREFNAAFEAERASRMEREQRIVDRIARQEHESIRRFDEERQTREQIYITAKKKLEDAVLARTKTDEKFQAAMWEELAAVKNAIKAEEKARITEDDDIAETLNKYVQKLQASLALMLSDDTGH